MTCTPACIQPSPSNAHCGAAGCHVTFGSVTGFDRHRLGRAQPDTAGGHLMDLEDQQRFQVEGATINVPDIWFTCERCQWQAELNGPVTLAELLQRADEHTEVCR